MTLVTERISLNGKPMPKPRRNGRRRPCPACGQEVKGSIGLGIHAAKAIQNNNQAAEHAKLIKTRSVREKHEKKTAPVSVASIINGLSRTWSNRAHDTKNSEVRDTLITCIGELQMQFTKR